DIEDHLRAAAALVEKPVSASPAMADYRQYLAERHAELVDHLLATGQRKEAAKVRQWDVDFYEKLIAQFPNDRNYALAVSQARGQLHVQLGEWDKAISDYSRAIELEPKNASAWNNLAWLLATCPEPKFLDPKRAVELARKAVELAPKAGSSWNTLGAAQYRTGNWKAAIEGLNKSMELRNGGDAFDWFFLAMAHWKQGAKDDARKWYDRAVEWMDKYA